MNLFYRDERWAIYGITYAVYTSKKKDFSKAMDSRGPFRWQMQLFYCSPIYTIKISLIRFMDKKNNVTYLRSSVCIPIEWVKKLMTNQRNRRIIIDSDKLSLVLVPFSPLFRAGFDIIEANSVTQNVAVFFLLVKMLNLLHSLWIDYHFLVVVSCCDFTLLISFNLFVLFTLMG